MGRIAFDGYLCAALDVESLVQERHDAAQLFGAEGIWGTPTPVNLGKRTRYVDPPGYHAYFFFEGLKVALNQLILACNKGVAATVEAEAGTKRNVQVKRNALRFMLVGSQHMPTKLFRSIPLVETGGRRVTRVTGKGFVVFGNELVSNHGFVLTGVDCDPCKISKTILFHLKNGDQFHAFFLKTLFYFVVIPCEAQYKTTATRSAEFKQVFAGAEPVDPFHFYRGGNHGFEVGRLKKGEFLQGHGKFVDLSLGKVADAAVV